MWLLLEKTNIHFFPTSITFVGRILLYLQNTFSKTDKSCYRFCKDTWDVTSTEHNKRMLSEQQKTINIDFGICCYCSSLLKVIMENVIFLLNTESQTFWAQKSKWESRFWCNFQVLFCYHSCVVSEEKVTKNVQCRQWVSIEQSKTAETWLKQSKHR